MEWPPPRDQVPRRPRDGHSAVDDVTDALEAVTVHGCDRYSGCVPDSALGNQCAVPAMQCATIRMQSSRIPAPSCIASATAVQFRGRHVPRFRSSPRCPRDSSRTLAVAGHCQSPLGGTSGGRRGGVLAVSAPGPARLLSEAVAVSDGTNIAVFKTEHPAPMDIWTMSIALFGTACSIDDGALLNDRRPVAAHLRAGRRDAILPDKASSLRA